jgi:hypothetical protein
MRRTPTLPLLSNGEEDKRISGAMELRELRKWARDPWCAPRRHWLSFRGVLTHEHGFL